MAPHIATVAVNPRAVANIDTRSTEEIVESIECHGQTIYQGTGPPQRSDEREFAGRMVALRKRQS
jgi:hypothetical protein